MRSKNIFKSKINFFLVIIFLYFLFYIIDISKINYKYVNKNFITFNSKNLSFELNKKIYYFYDHINFFFNKDNLSEEDKNFIINNQKDRQKMEKTFIVKSSQNTKKTNSYKKLLENWPRSHGNNDSNKFSNLKKINKENIGDLELAWIYNSNNSRGENLDIQCNPIVIDGIIYTPVIGGFIVAIDGSNGKELWRSEQFNKDVARRGLLYWKNKEKNLEQIFFNDGSKLIALNIKDGKKINSFGKKGEVKTGYSKITPIIYKDNIVIASWKKNIEVYDLYSGELKWKYHFGDSNKSKIGKAKYDNLKGGNPWGGISLDENRGIVFVTTGNPSNYFDGTNRLGKNYNSNSVIAIDLENQKQLWSFQETEHDIWNLDLPAPPILTSIKKDEEYFDVVVAVTKRGNTLILDRLTGEPFFDLNYRIAPKSKIKNEITSRYQLDIKIPEPFSKSVFSKFDTTDLSTNSKDFVESIVNNSSYGFFEPAKFVKNTIVYNFHGGAEWMGASIDHETQTMFVNSNEIPWIIKMEKDKKGKLISKFKRLKDPKGFPGSKPPWGKITSLNLNTGKINWSIPFGHYEEIKDYKLEKTGTENFGGLIATSSGLIFATGTLDSMFYVFDSKEGKELFRYKLPFIGSAPPTTYMYKSEQYIIVQSTGSYSLSRGYPEKNKFGDAIVAFKMKKKS